MTDTPGRATPTPEMDEAQREARLIAAKRMATGLLVFCVVLLVVARFLEPTWPWMSFLRAASEAALIGGLADWFAVTALFRHPLGIPIPHTAIIPTRKQRIGRGLGRFLQNHLLKRDRLAAQLIERRLGEQTAKWLAVPENAANVAAVIRERLPHVTQRLTAGSSELIGRALVSPDSQMFSTVVGNLADRLKAQGVNRELARKALVMGLQVAMENEDVLREVVRDQSPWWVPAAVADRLHRKLVQGLEETLFQASAQPHHPLRVLVEDALDGFLERFADSSEPMGVANEQAEELARVAIQEMTELLWERFISAPAVRAGDGKSGDPLTQLFEGLAKGALGDAELIARMDRWIADAVAELADRHRQEVARIVEETIEGWEAEEASRRIELYVGRDLQFIRVNGMVVGGLVGVILHALGRLP